MIADANPKGKTDGKIAQSASLVFFALVMYVRRGGIGRVLWADEPIIGKLVLNTSPPPPGCDVIKCT
jgi:hypothetical protein